MDFTNLFANLSHNGAQMNDQPSVPVSGDIDKVQRSVRGKRRASRGERLGPRIKRQCNWTKANRSDFDTFSQDDHSKTLDYHVQITDHEKMRAGFTERVANNCANEALHSGQKCKTNHSVNQQQKRKRTKHQKGRQQEQGWPQNQARSHPTKSSRKPETRTEPRKHMKNRNKTQPVKYFSPEFREQNIVLVNEQIVCRHFLHGKCIKGDSCQMQHIEARNDLIKKHCKYYLQGACVKGDHCPFMHNILCSRPNNVIVDYNLVAWSTGEATSVWGKVLIHFGLMPEVLQFHFRCFLNGCAHSFPCKFFHKKGKCCKGEDCRFSHEPLNDITTQLLNEVMALEVEYAKKNERSSVRPVTGDEPEVTQVPNPVIHQEANEGSGELVQPFKFNFYNSAEPNANNKETCWAEQVRDVTKEDAQACEAACQSPSVVPSPGLPVLYSVEAVLGLKSSAVFKTPSSPNPTMLSAPLASSGCCGLSTHCKVPYSVDVRMASKSTEMGHSPTAAAPMPRVESYTPTGQLSSASLRNKASDLSRPQNEPLRETTACQVAQEIHSDDTPALTFTSKLTQAEKCAAYMITGRTRHKSSLHCLEKEEKQNPTTDTTSSVDCAQQLKSSKLDFQSLFSSPPHLLSTPNPTNDFYPLNQSLQRSTPFQESTSVLTALINASSEFAACGKPNLPLQRLYSKNAKSALTFPAPQTYCSSGTTTQCKTETPSLPALGYNKTLKTPLKSLFASSVLDAPSSTTLSTPRHFTETVSATPKWTNIKYQDSTMKMTAKPDQTCANSLCSLFTTPPSPLSPPCAPQTNHSYQPEDTAALWSGAAQSEALIPTLVPQAASRAENDRLVDPKQQQQTQENAHRGTPTSKRATHQLLHGAHPPVDSSPAATSKSVLKTLFLSLSPYQQDSQ
ncbi:uncharacterized protein LOC127612983 [Hippocampus zosterae]|uniref:uncharacterized protein LOC127612983 n=1 Tax=Hippocampus zosterae TaxID=109293 RepID=UPI00223DC48C|nr:uncharacterized protein LOC127612983 [Hippocampus zosterae]